MTAKISDGPTDMTSGMRLFTHHQRGRAGSGLIVLLLLAFLFQALLSMRTTSAIWDEPTHIAAGYSYWKTRDGRMNRAHPPLVKLMAAAPLLLLNLDVPIEHHSWRDTDQYRFSGVFFQRSVAEIDRILFLARLPVLLLAVFLALLVHQWARELWGGSAALLALFLFVFEPTVLAHSRLATMDIPLATFVFAASYSLWKWLQERHLIHAVAASVTLGLALSTKNVALALLPLYCGLVLIHPRGVRGNEVSRGVTVRVFLQILGGAVLVVILVYSLAFSWRPLLRTRAEHPRVARILAALHLDRVPRLQTAIVTAGERLRLPPIRDYYLTSVLANRGALRSGSPAFLMGRYSTRGWWHYHLVAFVLKTPLPILLLVAVRVLTLRWFRPTAEEYFIVIPVIYVMLLSAFSTVNIGIRYLMPIYPFLVVWLSRLVALER